MDENKVNEGMEIMSQDKKEVPILIAIIMLDPETWEQIQAVTNGQQQTIENLLRQAIYQGVNTIIRGNDKLVTDNSDSHLYPKGVIRNPQFIVFLLSLLGILLALLYLMMLR